MADRTAKGTASLKASGATLTIPSVTIDAGACLVVGVGCDSAEGAPISVTHNGRTLRKKTDLTNATAGINVSQWLKAEYHNEQTGDIVIVWGAAIGKRAAFATQLSGPFTMDDVSVNAELIATANPATGRTGSLVVSGLLTIGKVYEIVTVGTTDFTLIGAVSNTVGEVFTATGAGLGTGTVREALDGNPAFVVCAFVAEGPGSEHGSATARIDDGNVWQAATVGQIEGTAGAPPVSNIAIVESYLELANQNATRGQLQGADSREWANSLLAVRPRKTDSFLRQGITPSDIAAVEEIVVAAGGDPDNMWWGMNEDTGEWEAYEGAAPGTLRARRGTDSVWVTA